MKAYKALVEGTAFYKAGHKLNEIKDYRFEVDMNFLKQDEQEYQNEEGVFKKKKGKPYFQDLTDNDYSRARFVAVRMLAKHVLRSENPAFMAIKECAVTEVDEVDIKEPKITIDQAKKMSGVELLKLCALHGEFFKAEIISSEVELRRKALAKIKPYLVQKSKPAKKFKEDI